MELQLTPPSQAVQSQAFGAMGMMTLFFVTGKILNVTGNYLPVFIVASVAYPVGLLIIQILVPHLDPAKIVEEMKPKELAEGCATPIA